MRLSLTILTIFLGCAGAALAETGVLLREGDEAPLFKAKGDDGREYSLAALRGKWVVLYFYPKDDSPGCTVQAQEFARDAAAYALRDAVVLGVSLDDAETHKAFREKHRLNFPLLTGGAAIAESYGVPLRFGYVSRQTFLIDPQGRIHKVFRSVKPAGHSKAILDLLPSPATLP